MDLKIEQLNEIMNPDMDEKVCDWICETYQVEDWLDITSEQIEEIRNFAENLPEGNDHIEGSMIRFADDWEEENS